jgi:hypothetical protein
VYFGKYRYALWGWREGVSADAIGPKKGKGEKNKKKRRKCERKRKNKERTKGKLMLKDVVQKERQKEYRYARSTVNTGVPGKGVEEI